MFDSFLKKNFWQSLFTGNIISGRTKFTFEELRALSDVLNKNQVVTEANRALVVETIRSIAEFMIWGDQNEPRIFDYFLEINVMHYLQRILLQPANRTGDVAKQVLQTLSIIIQNIRSETGTYFLFSNNHINNIVEIRFDFEDEEVLGYYISFLKTISLKLNARTVQFFIDRREGSSTFPLYSEAVKFAHHKEGMVRAGVRTLTLHVYTVPDHFIQGFVCQAPATAYFAEMVAYIADQVKILDKRMMAAEGFSAQVLSSLDSQLAEVEDMVSYVADILTTAHPRLAHLVAEQLWVSLVGPYLLRPLLEYSKAVDTSNTGSRIASTGGVTPASPKPSGSSPIVRAACSLYCLERLFMLITYQPLLHNLALALLDLRAAHPSCRSALVSVLHSEDHRAVPAALRCLVAILQSSNIAPEVLALLGMVPRSRTADLHVACAAGACAACELHADLPPLPEGVPAAGAPPDPLAEEAQPVATVASGFAGGSPLVFGYHVAWTRLEGASEWALARQGYGDKTDQDSSSASEAYGEEIAGDLAKPGALDLVVEEGPVGTAEQTAGQVHARDLHGDDVDHLQSGAADGLGVVSANGSGVSPQAAQEVTTIASPLEYGALGLACAGHSEVMQASDVDLLGLGDASSWDFQPQPIPRQLTGPGIDPLELDEMPKAAPPAAETYGMSAVAGSVGTSSTSPPGAAATNRLATDILVDLLDVGTGDTAQLEPTSDSAAVTPHTLLGATLGPATSLGSASEYMLDSFPESSSSVRRLGTGPGMGLADGAAAANQGCTGLQEPLLVALSLTAGVGVGPRQAEPAGTQLPEAAETPLLVEAVPVPDASDTASSEPEDVITQILEESLAALEVTTGPPLPGPLIVAASGVWGSVLSNNVGDAVVPGIGAQAIPKISSMCPSVLESTSSGPEPQGAREAGTDTVHIQTHISSEMNSVKTVAITATPPPPPPPPAAPPPPPSPPAPLYSGVPCAAHARHAAVSGSTDLQDALFAVLSMGLLPVQGLWHAGHLLQQLYPRVQEQRELHQQHTQQRSAEADSSGQTQEECSGTGGAESTAAVDAADGFGRLQPSSPPHPLDPSSTIGWECELSSEQREALRVAAVSAASAVLDEVGGMWCDALVAMLVMEWPTAHDAVMRPVLRTGGEQLMAGPHLYPRQSARSLSVASRNDQGLSVSAVAALHSYHAVARLVALLLLHDLLSKGVTDRTPPATVPPPAGAEVEGREWDVLEGQEVELQAGSAIPCIVSFSPGQERRVYFAAAGPALHRLGEYLQTPQALLTDRGSQSVVLHSSPAVVLADPAPTRLNAGIVLSIAPLLGSEPTVDKNVAKWLHVQVRPSVRGLLRLLRSAAGGRKGGLLGAARNLVDGHWVLAFPDAERASNARQLVEQSTHRLRALYCELLSPVLSTVMD